MSLIKVAKRASYGYSSPILRKAFLICSYFKKPEFVRLNKSIPLSMKLWHCGRLSLFAESLMEADCVRNI